MRSKGAQVSIAVVCLVLGIMLAVQFKTTQSLNTDLVPARVEELTQKLNTVTNERDTLGEEVLSLREKLKNVREDNQAMADLQEELQKANMVAGLVSLEGPGVIVTLNDSTRNLQAGENSNALIIHDSDLLMVVNELKASGAEAISINGERLTSMSEIRCAGTLILVNWAKIGPPFEIKAIGNPDMLESGLLIKNGFVESLKYLGIQVHIQKSEEVEIPAYSGRMDFTFAKPLQYKEKAE
ncbi:MAG: DUF881 domain-containing protein [Syntrophomonadaceae bacterium]|nr:DUF881 domain-containing protein [Syntrophomonadaceae bacterium]MDD3888824.1 DUF881 domain-containing protein [Syntrophomonadaceae bacterium]MDD4548201.1 DUF881 domain-containing protein [Syntrophomonadaceae bacterium]